MIFAIKFCADWTRSHEKSMDWRPVHVDFSIHHKKYFANGTRLESCCDLHFTTGMYGKHNSTNFIFIFAFFIEMFGIVPS